MPWTFIGNSDRDFSSRLSEGNVYRTGQGIALQGQRVDLLVDKAVVVELKSVIRFEEIHRAQVISYLRTLRLRAGLLINFRVPLLYQGIKRIVL